MHLLKAVLRRVTARCRPVQTVADPFAGWSPAELADLPTYHPRCDVGSPAETAGNGRVHRAFSITSAKPAPTIREYIHVQVLGLATQEPNRRPSRAG